MLQTVAKERETTVFGRRLRELREARDLSLKDLEDLTGIAHQTLFKYERGNSLPNWKSVEKLADALKVSADEFRDKAE